MPRLVYTAGVFHSNGEQTSVNGGTEAARLYDAFPKGGEFLSEDGRFQTVFSHDGGSFLYLTIDSTAKTLADKPQCNNYTECTTTTDTTT